MVNRALKRNPLPVFAKTQLSMLTSVAIVLVVRGYFNGLLVLFCVQCCVCRKRLSSPRCRSELIDSAWVVIVPGQKYINNKKKERINQMFQQIGRSVQSKW